MNKPKRIDARKHRKKNFNYLLKYNPATKPEPHKELTVRDKNGKSVIRNMEGITKPLIFADINYLLSDKQSLTDVDGVFEYNGNVFIVEEKTHYSSVNGGQLISLFNIAYNTYKSGKLAQLVYRISTGEEGRYHYEVFGSPQFKQFEDGKEITPDLVANEDNEFLAKRLRDFQDTCNGRWDKDRSVKRGLLFKAVAFMKSRGLRKAV
jgi:hypothetical protein